MIVLTTMFITVIVLALLWFLLLQRLPWSWAGYIVVLLSGATFLWFGTVHFAYIGIEIAAFGCLLIWSRHRWYPQK